MLAKRGSASGVGAGRHADRVDVPGSTAVEVIPLDRDLAGWIIANPGIVERYRAKVCPTPLGPRDCLFWLGALNGDTGHAKLHVRHEYTHTAAGAVIHTEWVVYGHQIAWVLAGHDLVPGQVHRHTCDEASCQNVDHLVTGTPGENLTDWHRRRFRWEGPLNDPRGPFGRAQALRDALLAAGDHPADQATAFRQAAEAGWRSIGQLTLLPTDSLPTLLD